MNKILKLAIIISLGAASILGAFDKDWVFSFFTFLMMIMALYLE